MKAQLLVTALILGLLSGNQASAEIIHREKSLYRNIEVHENRNRRCLVFAVKKGDRNQTCKDLFDPKRLVFPYVRMTMSGLLLNPNPASILIIGLGGGSIPDTLHSLYPDARIDVVEIDPAVVRVAQEFFDFEENEQVKVHVRDARVFIKRAGILGDKYDFVVLDAFTGDYIPEHLMTREFLEETLAIMKPRGVLVANTFSTSRLYDHESVTYEAVFGLFLNLRLPISGNRVILASPGALPTDSELVLRADALETNLTPFGVDLPSFPPNMSRERDWNTDRKVLTDQYSPANLLRDN